MVTEMPCISSRDRAVFRAPKGNGRRTILIAIHPYNTLKKSLSSAADRFGLWKVHFSVCKTSEKSAFSKVLARAVHRFLCIGEPVDAKRFTNLMPLTP